MTAAALAAAILMAAGDKPNIVLLLADDLGRGDLGCYGCEDIQTPAIDAIAKRGVRLTNAYAAASVCSPSRCGLMTGRHPVRVGVEGNVSSEPHSPGMPGSETTLAELARSAGLKTGLVGKWHLGNREGETPRGQGFEEFFGFHTGCINYYNHIHTYGTWRGHDLWRNETPVKEDGKYFTDLITREAVRFLEEHRERAFLLCVTYNAPHYPLQAPDEWFLKYKDLPGDRQAYAALTSAMDRSIATIDAKLSELGLDQETLVIFASDHGPSDEARTGGGGGSNPPFRGMKASLFDGGLRVPLVVRWPDRWPKGESRDAVVSLLDVYPTVAEVLGAALEGQRPLDGVSLVPVLEKSASPPRTLFWSHGAGAAVREGDHKLIVGPAVGVPAGKTWLADLASDPGERKNLADAEPQRAERLKARLDDWRRQARAEAERNR